MEEPEARRLFERALLRTKRYSAIPGGISEVGTADGF